MKAHPDNEAVFAKESIVKIAAHDIEPLKMRAAANSRNRMRLCAHRSLADAIHEMIIAFSKKVYIRPHKHINKSESFHVIEGAADVVIFKESGEIMNVIEMGDYRSGRKFYYRVSAPLYHSVVIRSDSFVYHEVTNGPFNNFSSLYAPWSPEEGNTENIKKFVEELNLSIEAYRQEPNRKRRTNL